MASIILFPKSYTVSISVVFSVIFPVLCPVATHHRPHTTHRLVNLYLHHLPLYDLRLLLDANA